MSIDWVNFTPAAALLGGGLIGLAAGLFFVLHGQIMGASGILGRFLAAGYDRQARAGWSWRLVFLMGVAAGPLTSRKLLELAICHFPSLLFFKTAVYSIERGGAFPSSSGVK